MNGTDYERISILTISAWNYGLNAGGWKFSPRCRYVISDSLFRRMVEDMEKQGKTDSVASWSCFNSYERRYGGQDLNGRRLAIYRENGFGDSLMVTGLAGYLKHTYPQCTIDVYGMPRVFEAWLYNQDANFLDVPPPFDSINNGYDYHLFFEGMIENDNEPEQTNSYDTFLRFAGIYPKDVPANFKRPQLYWGESDELAESEWLKLRPARDYAVLHWNPSGMARMYPPELSRKVVTLLAERMDVVIVGNTEGTIEPPNLDVSGVHDWTNKTPNFRGLMPMIKHARAVICPDSSVLHLATAFPDVPMVSLWGSFHPNDRAKYYRSNTSLESFHVCPSAPCRAQRSELPHNRCQQAKGYTEGTIYCTAMAAITPERVVETVLSKL